MIFKGFFFKVFGQTSKVAGLKGVEDRKKGSGIEGRDEGKGEYRQNCTTDCESLYLSVSARVLIRRNPFISTLLARWKNRLPNCVPCYFVSFLTCPFCSNSSMPVLFLRPLPFTSLNCAIGSRPENVSELASKSQLMTLCN